MKNFIRYYLKYGLLNLILNYKNLRNKEIDYSRKKSSYWENEEKR